MLEVTETFLQMQHVAYITAVTADPSRECKTPTIDRGDKRRIKINFRMLTAPRLIDKRAAFSKAALSELFLLRYED